MTLSRFFVAAAGGVILVALARGCAHPAPTAEPTPPQSRARLFDGMGGLHRAVSTRSPEAQRYFDQGLTWMYAFNHDEAIRSFEHAAALDPNLAAAWWAVALCHGPHINNPVVPEARSKAAWEALEKARALAGDSSDVERALIDALGARYAWPAPADRRPLDEAYAAAMQRVHAKFPNDPDVATLYAESLMDLQPWDLWTHEGAPKGRTEEIVALLEGALAMNPKHPGAAHLYIHAVEASMTPERALPAANTLRRLVPASGHLTHMPSHIDVRVGQWRESAAANRLAIEADAAYRRLSPRQDFYRVYMLHNHQFLSFTAMMMGREEEAIGAALGALETVPPAWVRENASAIDGYMTIHMDALKRFGRWERILSLAPPPDCLPFTTAMWRMTRAVAHAASGDLAAAETERARFEEACARVPAGAVAMINPAEKVLSIARRFLAGEIAYAKRDYSTAIAELRAAAAIEDSLRYMEPPDWAQPVRHALGAVLMDAGDFAGAERAYREDLGRWPKNGWSLLGLSRALEAQGRASDASLARAEFQRAWADASISPHASCLCAPKRR